MLFSTFRYLTYSITSFSAVCFSESSSHGPPFNKAVTPIVTKWTDDYQLASSSSNGFGWSVCRKHWNDDEKHFENEPLDQVPETEQNSTTFWGPLIMRDEHQDTHSPDNYFGRWFQCESDTSSVIVQYHTAICGPLPVNREGRDGTHHLAASRGITQLWVDWYGDMNAEGTAHNDYVATMSEPIDGYDPYQPGNVEGAPLDYQQFQVMCKTNGRRGRGMTRYWTQTHGVRWIPRINQDGKRVLPAKQPFRTVINVQSGSKWKKHPEQVLLFGITVECFEHVEEAPITEIQDKKEHHEVIGMISEEDGEGFWNWWRIIALTVAISMMFSLFYKTYKKKRGVRRLSVAGSISQKELAQELREDLGDMEMTEADLEKGHVYDQGAFTIKSTPQSPKVAVLRRRSSVAMQDYEMAPR